MPWMEHLGQGDTAESIWIHGCWGIWGWKTSIQHPKNVVWEPNAGTFHPIHNHDVRCFKYPNPLATPLHRAIPSTSIQQHMCVHNPLYMNLRLLMWRQNVAILRDTYPCSSNGCRVTAVVAIQISSLPKEIPFQLEALRSWRDHGPWCFKWRLYKTWCCI